MLSEALGDPPIDGNDLDLWIQNLTIAFNIDHYDTDTLEHSRAVQVYEIAQSEGWGKGEFKRAVMRFVKVKRFATWTPADFFEEKRPKLYTHREWETMPPADRSGLEMYEVPGHEKHMWGNPAQCDRVLTRWPKKERPKELMPPKPEIKPEVKESISETLERLRLEEKLQKGEHYQLQLRCAAMENELSARYDEIDRLATRLEETEAELSLARTMIKELQNTQNQETDDGE